MSAPSDNSARLPLAGRRILITRARKQAGSLAELLRRQGATVTQIPAIEIREPRSHGPLDAALANIESYDWLILTSVNGVDALMTRLDTLKLTPRVLSHLRVAAIGPATRAALAERGVRTHVMPHEYVAEAVARKLTNRVRNRRVLLVRAKVARDVIPRELRRAGARVDVVEAYRTGIPKGSAARLGMALGKPQRLPDIITFTSSSTVRNFMTLLAGEGRLPASIALASIGPVTSATLRELGLKPSIEAREYTMAGLAKAIVAAVKKKVRA